MSATQAGFDFGVHPRDRVDRKRLAEFSPAQARREAHATVMLRKQRMYAQILAWAKQRRDFVVDELVADWQCSVNHVAPRCTEMLQIGKLVATGARRRTRAGKSAAVLRAA